MPESSLRGSRLAAILTGIGGLLVAARVVTAAGVADWPRYRGPAGDGISEERGLAKAWPPSGPKVVWRVPLGDGYSGIVVSAGSLYTMYSRDGSEFAAAFDAATGREKWKVRLDSTFPSDMGDGPRSTPVVDRDMVIALGARGKLVGVRTTDGSTLWMKDLTDEFGTTPPHWGVSTSPVIDNDLVLIDAGGGPGRSLVALERATGRTRWTASNDRPGYSTPLPVDLHGTRQILNFSGTSLVSVSAADGKVLWSIPWKTAYEVNAAMPVFIPPDRVFISSSYDTGGAVYRITKTGAGMSAEEVWKNRVMKNHFNSSVYSGGSLYGFDDKTLKCVDASNGEERWRQSGFAKGSLLMADGHLIILSESGLLALAEATPEAYREKGRFQILEGRTWTMPTLSSRKLYLRNQKEMVAVDLAG